jgi:Fic family protein
VLDGETVLYAGSDNIRATLEYDFEQEKRFNYKGLTQQQIIEHIARFVADLWQIHIFGEGNTRTTAVFLIKYLRKLGFNDVGNDLFAQHSWYFRNALVRANYKNLKRSVYATNKYIEQFLGNLLLGENNILKNRELHIDFVATESTPNKTEANGGANGGVNDENGGVSLLQKQIIDFMQQNPQISVAEIAKQSNKPRRTIENNVKKLKEKGIISRVGSDKTGSWKILANE